MTDMSWAEVEDLRALDAIDAEIDRVQADLLGDLTPELRAFAAGTKNGLQRAREVVQALTRVPSATTPAAAAVDLDGPAVDPGQELPILRCSIAHTRRLLAFYDLRRDGYANQVIAARNSLRTHTGMGVRQLRRYLEAVDRR